ncbi:subtilisin-like protein [Hypoxylon sp. EC38]|nr:subtilisin-like protein [Hypoxylon sp. EC38]
MKTPTNATLKYTWTCYLTCRNPPISTKVLSTREPKNHEECTLLCEPHLTFQKDYKIFLHTDKTSRLCKTECEGGADYDCEADLDWEADHLIALDQFVPFNELKYRDKLVLSVILARAVLHLLGTGWLRSDWGMEDIFVLCRNSEGGNSEKSLNLRRPYLKTNFTEPASSPDNFLHRHPQILRLGIVIMQIMLSDRLEEDMTLRGHIKVNGAILKARKLYEKCQHRLPSEGKLLQAIKNCKSTRLFNISLNEKGSSTEVTGLFYTKVVKTLEEAMWEDEGLLFRSVAEDNEKRLIHNALINHCSLNLYSEGNKRGVKRNFSRYSAGYSQGGRDGGNSETYALAEFVPDSSTPSQNSQIWCSQQGVLTREFLGKEPMGKTAFERLIKVAIFDTGCNLEHDMIKPHLDGYNGRRRISGIHGWKDFVHVNSSKMEDTSRDGHGTFMTYLLLETLPKLKVFIARVFDGLTTEDPEVSARVAEATKYAVNTWDVDIISMSFHLSQESQSVKDAISEYANRGVLFFAAAGNSFHGEKSSVAFPGTFRDVICIYSHDENYRASSFAPVQRNWGANFAVIGEGLLGPGGEDSKKHMNGTSCSTSIAAAFAASVLHFSRIYEDELTRLNFNESDKMKLKRLKEHRVMKKVFFDLMVEPGTKAVGKHNIVNPTHLFTIGTKDGSTKDEKITKIITLLIDIINRTDKERPL